MVIVTNQAELEKTHFPASSRLNRIGLQPNMQQ
jgi:hypothetical protein